ncbi:hypothetical protein MTO98_07050 [Mucilaginibacter sp. SMC90]|uniref:hypothetical protein n=1 Tax=Mucilaginibacter sp. SMC90 TaxID=2929803 RepID=UPI001FB248A5|nr:hypothetical protein [Mucilaginibacter sp. SMC90]UOE50832.1 hypothetical protein MTO98_07050 [Mucilaginibacter sp. SMC90]
MIRINLLLCLLFSAVVSFAQKETVRGFLITSTGYQDTSRTLYVSKGVNQLSAYTVENNKATEAASYRLSKSSNDFALYCKSDQSSDTLKLAFQDQAHAVIVNSTDRYVLFPAFYKRFKHPSILDILDLLSDGVKEYPINGALLFQAFSPQTGRHIQKATVVTQRSQADLQDTWICKYFYNKTNQLDSVSAADREEVRYYKKIHYKGAAIQSEKTYLNIESRQVNHRTIVFKYPFVIKMHENVLEIGKNRETISNVTITKSTLPLTKLFKLINKYD